MRRWMACLVLLLSSLPSAGETALLYHWPLTTDANGVVGGVNCTAAGDATFSGGTAVLDGTGDYFTCGTGIHGGTAAISVAACINVDVKVANQRFVSKWGSEFLLGATGDGNNFIWAVQTDTGNEICNTEAPFSWSVSTWYRVVGTYNGTACTFYVNGIDSGVVTSSGSGNIATGSTNLRIGAEGTDGSLSMDGKINGVRIYDSALSSGEVTALPSCPETGAAPPATVPRRRLLY